MYNGNTITAEVRIVRDPERNPSHDVVKAGGAIFQGKREEGKDPIWVQLNAWKYQAKCLETVQKNDVLIVTGSLSQDSWESNGEKKTKIVITCDTIAKKIWGNQQTQQQPQQPQNYNQNQGYGNQGQQPGYNQQGNFGGEYQAPPDDSSIPF